MRIPSILDLSLSHVASGARTQLELANFLRASGCITSETVYSAIASVDRARFVPKSSSEVYAEPYENKPIPLGYGATISTPAHHATVAELLASALPNSGAGSRFLDLGCGTGYLSEVLAIMSGDPRRVVGVDAVQPLVDFAHEVAMPGTRFECGWSVSCVRDRVGECDFDAVHVGFAVTREALDELLPRTRTEWW